MRILIRAVNWIGDTILTTPAVHALTELFPKSTIHLLVKEHLVALWQNNPDINEIIPFNDQTTLPAIIRRIREGNFSLAFVFPNSFSSALPIWLAKVPVRIGYACQFRGFMLTKPIKRTKEILKKHLVDYYLNLIYSFAEKILHTKHELILNVSQNSREKVEVMFSNYGIKENELLIGINAGAAYGNAKRWLPERYAELANRLQRKFAAKIFLFGSKEELEYITAISDLIHPKPINLAGKTNLYELVAIVERLNLLVTNDTGVMHIASALKIPTVAIFGSTDPTITGPYGEGPFRVIIKPTDCSPCFKRECPIDHKCMTAITVDDVFEVCAELLQMRVSEI